MLTVDLRSDTVTLPTPEMRKAMYEAEVGDAIYNEDPSVTALEELAAAKLGKEAGVFVVSGTMGNLVSLLSHCQRGDEVIMGDQAHIFWYEAGGISALCGAMVHRVPNLANGLMDPDEVDLAIRDTDNPHFPRTSCICLENTHNRRGGVVQTPAEMATIKAVADKHGLAVHLDGARVFNAAVALGIDVADLAAQVDSVQICLSKGLAAPVGSVVCGSAEFREKAVRARKIVGGAMRQAGVIAAAGIVALNSMVDRLAEDHANAKRLAEGLAAMPGYSINMDSVQTNMVRISFTDPNVDARDVSPMFLEHGVKINAADHRTLRAVTHYGLDETHVDATLLAAERVIKELAA